MQSPRIARDVAVATSIGALAKVAAIGREVLIAALAGASRGVDAFFVAMIVPMTLGGLLGTATHAAFVPYLARYEPDDAAATRFINSVLTVTVLLGAAVVVGIELIADPIIGLVGPGMTPGGRGDAVAALRLVTPLLVLSPLEGLVSAVFQVRGRVGYAALCLASNPAATLVAIAVAWPFAGVGALAIATLCGSITSVVLLCAGLPKVRHALAPDLDRGSAQLRGLTSQIVPLLVATSVLTTNTAIDRAVATTLGTGAVAALAFGSRIIYAPLDLVINAVTAVLFPNLARAQQRPSSASSGTLLSRSLASAAPLLMPAIGLASATGYLLVRLLYQHGAFTQEAAGQTTAVVVALSPLLLLIAYQGVLIRAFQAQLRTRTLAVLAVVNALTNLVLDLALAPLLGVGGIALSTSLTIALVVVLMAILSRHDAGFHLGAILGSMARALVVTAAALAAAAAVLWLAPDNGSVFAAAYLLVGSWGAGIVSALLVSRAVGLTEPMAALRVVRSSLRELTALRARRGKHRGSEDQ